MMRNKKQKRWWTLTARKCHWKTPLMGFHWMMINENLWRHMMMLRRSWFGTSAEKRRSLCELVVLLAENKTSSSQLLEMIKAPPAGEFVPKMDRNSLQKHSCLGLWHDLKRSGEECHGTTFEDTAFQERCG